MSSPCWRCDLIFSCQVVALSHLDSLPSRDFVNCTNGSDPFCFGKGGSVVLINCSLCGTEATLFYLAGPVCSSFSAKICKRFADLDSTNKTVTPLRLSLCPCYAFLFSILPSISLSIGLPKTTEKEKGLLYFSFLRIYFLYLLSKLCIKSLYI